MKTWIVDYSYIAAGIGYRISGQWKFEAENRSHARSIALNLPGVDIKTLKQI